MTVPPPAETPQRVELAEQPNPSVADYLSSLVAEKGRSPATARSYRSALGGFVGWLDGPLDGATPQDIAAYVAYLRDERHAAPATRAQAFAAISGLYRFLTEEGRIETNPAAGLDAPKPPDGLPKALALEQVLALLRSPVADAPAGVRDLAMLEVLYGTGVRVSELVGLDVADVDLSSRVIRVLGKGQKERIVPVGRPAAAALNAWFSGAGRGAMLESGAARWGGVPDTAAVFVNQRGRRLTRRGAHLIVQRHGDRAGIDRSELTPHVLRHSCATHMLNGGADVRIVQELLGHASVGTTQRYTKVTIGRLAEVYAAAHPRARAQ